MKNISVAIFSWIKSESCRQFIRYNLVQIVRYVLEFSLFLLLPKLSSHLLLSNCTAKTFAATFAFFLHKHFTFKKKNNAKLAKEILCYVALFGIHILLSSAMLLFFYEFFAPWLAKFISDVCYVAISFILVRNFVFKDSN